MNVLLCVRHCRFRGRGRKGGSRHENRSGGNCRRETSRLRRGSQPILPGAILPLYLRRDHRDLRWGYCVWSGLRLLQPRAPELPGRDGSGSSHFDQDGSSRLQRANDRIDLKQCCCNIHMEITKTMRSRRSTKASPFSGIAPALTFLPSLLEGKRLKYQQFASKRRVASLERETGIEPATFSLGS